ncbi:hypothetical protein GCM10010272_42760 [Streptomyces lateritius]|nr:hypothetical protein GCM10010272_42760 [Streptomyces lateritius]
MGGRAGGDLQTRALDLVHLAADALQAAPLAVDGDPGARGVMHPAPFQARMRAAAHGDTGLTGRDDLALLEHPARAVEYGDADAGRIVDRAATDGRAGRPADLQPGGGSGHDPQVEQLRSAVLDEQRGRGGVLALDVQILNGGRGPNRQRYAVQRRDPHRADTALGAAQGDGALDDEVLPVGPGRDGEDVPVPRGLQGRGEGGVLTRAAPPPRCAGVRHLDRALCHGCALPPPHASLLIRCPTVARAAAPG